MGILDVPGASIYYEETGKGPLMVLIPGGNGTAHIYNGLARELAAHFTVVTYDRRGFSRSRLEGPQDDGQSVASGYVVGGLSMLLAALPLAALRARHEKADVIVGVSAGKAAPCAAQGLPAVAIVDTLARQPEPASG